MQTLKPSPVALPPALIYAAALTCGVLAALALQIYLSSAGFDLAGPWQRFRLLRWIGGAIIVLALAQIGHPSAAPEAVGAGVGVAVRLVALAVAAVMALMGAYVAVRR